MAAEDFINIKIYEPRNLGSVPGHVYLGKSDTIETDRQSVNGASRNNCLSVFLWASIVGGSNIRIDPFTDTDPYTFIDQRWFDLRPYKYWFEHRTAVANTPEADKLHDYYENLDSNIAGNLPESNVISSRSEYVNNVDPIYQIRNLTSDGSVVIDANGGAYWFGSDAEPHGSVDNSNPTDELVLKINEYNADCNDCDAGSIITTAQNDIERLGRIYTVRRLKGKENIALYTGGPNGSYRSPILGDVEEDLSDLLPAGVIQVVYEGPCIKTEGVTESVSYGGSDLSTAGGFWIGNTFSVTQSGADVFGISDVTTNSTTHSISGAESTLTLRAVLPEDWDWFKDDDWYTGTGDDTVKIIWKLDSIDAHIKAKDPEDLMDELGDFYNIDISGLTIEEFEPLLSNAVDTYVGEDGTYTGIKHINAAVESEAIVELVWDVTGQAYANLDLVIIVNDLYSYKWSTTISAVIG